MRENAVAALWRPWLCHVAVPPHPSRGANVDFRKHLNINGWDLRMRKSILIVRKNQICSSGSVQQKDFALSAERS